MAVINSQTLFLTTSPRTPEKMMPEIKLLADNFSGKPWNKETQGSFMRALRDADFYHGRGKKDAAFSARDRINRAPKSLGFIRLKPVVQLTDAGKSLLTSHRTNEVFLRQMLKFQIPSPFHKPTGRAAKFCIKPYLEILRLVRTLGTLSFDELRLFGMQLTDWHKFDTIVGQIHKFRKEKTENKGKYRKFYSEYINSELKRIYERRIASGDTKTRESADRSLKNFLNTQSRNLRDYADACFRYLRATGLVNVSYVGKSLSIITERIEDTDFILENVSRDPVFFDSENSYVEYLGNAKTPKLLTDDIESLAERINNEFPEAGISEGMGAERLKDILAECVAKRKDDELRHQIKEIKDYKQYDDIQDTFNRIKKSGVYDAPLLFEWNTWRAMTMLDGGTIKANLNFDDYGRPMSTAQGNQADIVCDYGSFILTVEVTLASGQKQYEMESEPVSRHLGQIRRNSGKTCYTLFVAPKINDACVAHFFGLHNLNISYYGGESIIVPLPLDVFQKMLEDSHNASYEPNPAQVKAFFEKSREIAKSGCNERQWFDSIKNEALDWLK